MIEIEDKKQCCGCAACVQLSPQQCVAMMEDSEGFCSPQVNVIICIKCGLCNRVCPLLSSGVKIIKAVSFLELYSKPIGTYILDMLNQ